MEYEINNKKNLRKTIREIKEYRELFYFFTVRDIKIKYKQAALGFAWALLQPLFMSLVFTLFLGKIISSNASIEMPYPLFVITGMIIWNLFSAGLTGSANSMVSNSNIIKKIYFPRLIIPVSSILVAIFDFLMSLIVLVPFMIYYNTSFTWLSLIYIPLALVVTALNCLGLGAFLSALNIKYRDVRYVIPFFIQMLLFITPVIYPANLTSYSLITKVVELNPMTAALDLFRASFNPSFHIKPFFIINLLTSFLICVSGIWYFRKTENYFADIA